MRRDGDLYLNSYLLPYVSPFVMIITSELSDLWRKSEALRASATNRPLGGHAEKTSSKSSS
jgi:hypothetical protein